MERVSSYKEFVTFPTDPLYFDVPAAPSARAQVPEWIDIEAGVNDRGQSFGTGDDIDSDTDLPDLVAAIGTNGEIGYVRRRIAALRLPLPSRRWPARTVDAPYRSRSRRAHCHRGIRYLLIRILGGRGSKGPRPSTVMAGE